MASSGMFIMLLLYMVISYLPLLFQADNGLFWISTPHYWLLFVFLIPLFMALYLAVIKIFHFESYKSFSLHPFYSPMKFIKNHIVACSLICLALLYIMVFDTTYVTSNSINVKKPFNPTGITYRYDDIIGVNTGFYGMDQGLSSRDKGSFYYIISLIDGRQINFDSLNTIMEDSTETYDIIESFDNTIMEKNIPKISDVKSLEYCHFDEKYKLQLSNILLNK